MTPRRPATPARTANTARAVLVLGTLLAAACAPAGDPTRGRADRPARDAAAQPVATEAQRAFLERYREFCGETFAGRSVMVDLGDDHPLDGARLRMTLESCDADEVRIPFQVDDDRSRTWILTRDESGLRLAHDHRYEDGTEHEANFYGGYADDTGSATRQRFPADDRTIADRPAREINVWEKEFDVENQKYYYRLYLRGELRYEAEFDLGPTF
jgi:hypothetical protein